MVSDLGEVERLRRGNVQRDPAINQMEPQLTENAERDAQRLVQKPLPWGEVDAVASWYGLHWSEVRRAPEAQTLPLLRSGLPRPNRKASAELRREITAFLQARQLRLKPKQVDDIMALAYGARFCETRREQIERDKTITRRAFRESKTIQAQAWKSIRYFQRRCEKAGRVVGFDAFSRKILPLADQRKKIFGDAASELTNPTLQCAYQVMAGEFGAEKIAPFLAEIKARRWSRRPSLPPQWIDLLFELRRSFYEADPRLAARDVLKRDPRLRRYPYRELARDLAVFNLVSYFRILGWSQTRSLTVAGPLVRRLIGPRHGVSGRAETRTTFQRFASRFAPELRLAAPPAPH